MANRDDLIGVVEVCRLLAISRSTLERRSRLPGFPVPSQHVTGGHRKWLRADIEALIPAPQRDPVEAGAIRRPVRRRASIVEVATDIEAEAAERRRRG